MSIAQSSGGINTTVFRLQAKPRIQEMNRRTMWHGVKSDGQNSYPDVFFRPGAFVSPTPSIEMGNKKNGEEMM